MKKAALVVVLLVALLAFVQVASAAVTLGDGGFEAGRPNPYWSESSTHGYFIITGGGARTGTYKAWLGGTDGAGEVSTIWQTFKMPKKGTVTLSFWLRVPSYDPAGSDKLQVLVDGTKLLTIKEVDGAVYSTYQQVLVDLSAFVDGGTHTLTFKGTDKSGANTSWYIDDVSLQLQAFKNASFEDDSNADNIPDGWKVVSPSGQTRRVCDEAHSGSCSARLKGTGGTEQLIYVWKPGPTGKNGDVFLFAGYLKLNSVPAGTNAFYVYATNLSGVEQLVYAIPISSGTWAWTLGSASFSVPFDYKKLRIVFETTASSGTIWIDDVALTQTGGPVPAPPAPGSTLVGE